MVGIGRREGSSIPLLLRADSHRPRKGDTIFAPLVETKNGPIILNSGEALAINPMEAGAQGIFIQPPFSIEELEKIDGSATLEIVEDDVEGEKIRAVLSDSNELSDEEEKEIKETVADRVVIDHPREIFDKHSRQGSLNKLLSGHL